MEKTTSTQVFSLTIFRQVLHPSHKFRIKYRSDVRRLNEEACEMDALKNLKRATLSAFIRRNFFFYEFAESSCFLAHFNRTTQSTGCRPSIDLHNIQTPHYLNSHDDHLPSRRSNWRGDEPYKRVDFNIIYRKSSVPIDI